MYEYNILSVRQSHSVMYSMKGLGSRSWAMPLDRPITYMYAGFGFRLVLHCDSCRRIGPSSGKAGAGDSSRVPRTPSRLHATRSNCFTRTGRQCCSGGSSVAVPGLLTSSSNPDTTCDNNFACTHSSFLPTHRTTRLRGGTGQCTFTPTYRRPRKGKRTSYKFLVLHTNTMCCLRSPG